MTFLAPRGEAAQATRPYNHAESDEDGVEVRKGPNMGTEAGDLVVSISDCIPQADAGGLHVVAAHLETAMHALPPSGDPATEAPDPQDG